MLTIPKQITLVEVGPRDGLQNEKKIIPTSLKIQFINQLSETGIPVIETTSFVSPKWIPQLADNQAVMQSIKRSPSVSYMALVPNSQGFAAAVVTQTPAMAVFIAASETFSQKNINCSIEESLNRVGDVIHQAQLNHIPVRGYISCAVECPYEGRIAAEKVSHLAEKLIQLGCYQVSLGDTIGVATPNQAEQLIDAVQTKIPVEKIAVHFHDTYAQALTNIYVSLQKGVSTIDTAVAGLGGCPYAPGAGGNVATEDVVYMLEGLGIKTGINLRKVTEAGWLICDFLKQSPRSKVSLALKHSKYR